MRQVLMIFIAVLVLGFQAGIGSAQQGSKGIVPKPGAAYNPETVYAGDYNTEMLVFKNRSKDVTWRSVPKLNRLSKVTCSSAVEQLKREGRWQGHLRPDGSCGSTAEPADWALGNRLNYEEALAQATR